jgi:hypothetical protein
VEKCDFHLPVSTKNAPPWGEIEGERRFEVDGSRVPGHCVRAERRGEGI